MKTAMLLAAGRGERLRPITLAKPKALCEINNKPSIEHHIINLAKAGFARIIINHAYLGAQIRQYLGNGKRWGVEILYSPEPCGGLETGGGIFQALPLLGKEPFLTVNADVYTDYDFSTLNLPSTKLAKIILIPNSEPNLPKDFGFDSMKQVVTNTQRLFTFAGIAYYHPIIFSNSSIGRYSVTPIIRQLAEKGQVAGEVYQGLWIDIGSVERLNRAKRLAMACV